MEGEKNAIATMAMGPGKNFSKLKQALEKYSRVVNSTINSNGWNKANDIIGILKNMHKKATQDKK